MSKYRVGFIGTGKNRKNPSGLGYAMAYLHADGYKQLSDDCEMVACADIVEENARLFADTYGFSAVYTDYHEMLAKENLDIVSICVWPHLHCEMTVAACAAGVKAVNCEKPMALTFGEARTMLQVAEQHGTVLVFNHQRRFGLPFRRAYELAHRGELGALVRMEAAMGDLYDGGTHWVDMLNYFNDESPAEWVIGQIDAREDRRVFGAPVETQAICHVKYRNGVYGLFATGQGMHTLGCPFRLICEKGVIEVDADSQSPVSPDPGPMLRYRVDGVADWQSVDCKDEHLHGPGYIERAMADLVDCLNTGREPELCARHAMNATEIIFACYESSRRRGRVDLPLTITDSPIGAMIEKGKLAGRRHPTPEG